MIKSINNLKQSIQKLFITFFYFVSFILWDDYINVSYVLPSPLHGTDSSLTVHTLPTLDLLIYITTDGCWTTIRFFTNMATIQAIRQTNFLNVSEILVSVFYYSKIDQAFYRCLICS